MANTMIVLLYVIISIFLIQVNCLDVTSLPKNYIMADENKTWADNQMKKAQKKCNEYQQYACQYQTPEDIYKHRLVSREYVSEGMLPHMAFLHIRKVKTEKKKPFVQTSQCTGTLISERFVLTAGRCVNEVSSDTQIKIKLGSSDSTNDATGQWYGVEDVYQHPYYNYYYENILHDIALVKLSKMVHFNTNVRPICLNTNYNISTYNGDSVTTAAWGYIEDGYTDRLKMVQLPVNEPACYKWLRLYTSYPRVAELYSICAGETKLEEREKIDTCDGDSGGPLQVLMKNTCSNMYEQIGVTVYGNGNCSLGRSVHIGVFTNVAHYVPWIASIVWPEFDDHLMRRS